MRHSVTIDFAGDKFQITCPMWANELVKNLPSRRWSKAKRAWQVPLLRLTVDGIKNLTTIEGVLVTPAARKALEGYAEKKAKAPSGDGFPSWYPFRKEPYPPAKHQLKVLDKMWRSHCYGLHHDMGTFKTRTFIDFACAKRMSGDIDAMLIVVKLSGRRNWREQFVGPLQVIQEDRTVKTYDHGWAPIPVDLFLPDTDYKQAFFKWMAQPHDFKVMVVGVESLSQGRMKDWMMDFMMTRGRVLMVIDESHLISNHKALRTEACFEAGKQAVWRGTGTGTPISKGPLNLYSQFEFLDPDIIGIGDFYAFRNRYAVVIEKKTKAGQKYPMIVGYQNIEELTKTVAPYTDEVRKSDVLELPPKNYLPHVYVQATKEQRELYSKIKEEGAYLLKGTNEQVVKNVLELGLRLHQVAQGFMPTYEETPYIGRKGDDRIRRIATWHPVVPLKRNPKLIELVDIAGADRQFIVWCSYRVALEAIVQALSDEYPKDSIVQIHGGISENDRAVWRNEYQRGKHKFMVGNMVTGGTSDTWTACETMVYYDNTENMIDRLQSEDRAHRGGLRHPVDYIDLVMEKTVDVTRIKSIEQKVDLAEYIRRNIRDAAKLLEGG